MSIMGPAPRPCESCPYRKDVESGIWAHEEYEKLRAYDQDTVYQPLAVFQCHQADSGSDRSRMCAGWVGCHGDDLLALRLHGVKTGDYSAMEYTTPVPLFSSGNEAADHGQREIDSPSDEASRKIEKIKKVRKNLLPDRRQR